MSFFSSKETLSCQSFMIIFCPLQVSNTTMGKKVGKQSDSNQLCRILSPPTPNHGDLIKH